MQRFFFSFASWTPSRSAWLRVLHIVPLVPHSFSHSFKDSSFLEVSGASPYVRRWGGGQEGARLERGTGWRRAPSPWRWRNARTMTSIVMHPLLQALMFNHEPIDADPFPPMPHILLRDSPLPVIHKPKSFHLIPVSGWSYHRTKLKKRLDLFWSRLER